MSRRRRLRDRRGLDVVEDLPGIVGSELVQERRLRGGVGERLCRRLQRVLAHLVLQSGFGHDTASRQPGSSRIRGSPAYGSQSTRRGCRRELMSTSGSGPDRGDPPIRRPRYREGAGGVMSNPTTSKEGRRRFVESLNANGYVDVYLPSGTKLVVAGRELLASARTRNLVHRPGVGTARVPTRYRS